MKTSEQRVAEAESTAQAARAGEKQAMRGEREARALWRAAADRAGLWERKAGKIIEQAGAWKRRALTAEADLRLAREQARHRESELVLAGRQQLLEAQALALDTIQRVAAQLPLDTAIISAEVIEPNIEVDTWFGEDDVPVVQIDTPELHGRLRINLNDGVVWDGDPETDERPGKNAELVEWEQRALAQAETISRQLDTIRDQDERIDMLKDREQALLKDNSSLRSILTDRSAEVNTLTQALDVCHWKLADAIRENRQLDESLADMRKLAEANGTNVNVLSERLAETENESAEVIRKCNEQLAALAAAAKLRDQQVETLARLWLSAFEQTGSPVGAVITRQLYRVMADHGIDVTCMPEPLTIDRADCA